MGNTWNNENHLPIQILILGSTQVGPTYVVLGNKQLGRPVFTCLGKTLEGPTYIVLGNK